MAVTGNSLTVRRMRASGVVIIAAALTTLVTAALAATFAVYSAGALPQAVRHNLATASGTTLLVSGAVDRGQADQITASLPGQLGQALGHAPFRFDSAVRSNALGFIAGARPAAPAGAGSGSGSGGSSGGSNVLISRLDPAPSTSSPPPFSEPISAEPPFWMTSCWPVPSRKTPLDCRDDLAPVTVSTPLGLTVKEWAVNVRLPPSEMVSGTPLSIRMAEPTVMAPVNVTGPSISSCATSPAPLILPAEICASSPDPGAVPMFP